VRSSLFEALHIRLFASYVGITSAMFKEKENVPAMSIAALEKKYHCVIEIKDTHQHSVATAGHHRHADIINTTNKDIRTQLAVLNPIQAHMVFTARAMLALQALY